MRRILGENRHGRGRRQTDRPSQPDSPENYYEHVEATGRLRRPDFAR